MVLGDQTDMQYRDLINGTTEWKDHIANVKASTTKPSTIPEFTEDPKKVQLVGRKTGKHGLTTGLHHSIIHLQVTYIRGA